MSDSKQYYLYITGKQGDERRQLQTWNDTTEGIDAFSIDRGSIRDITFNAVDRWFTPNFAEVTHAKTGKKQYTVINHGDDNEITLDIMMAKLKASIAALGNTNNNNILEIVKRQLELAISKLYFMKWAKRILGNDIVSIHFNALEDATVGHSYSIEDLCFMKSDGTECKWWDLQDGDEEDRYHFDKIDDMMDDVELARHIGNIDYYTSKRNYENGMIVIRESHLLSDYEEL